jgi:large subunit ribosomal protein L9
MQVILREDVPSVGKAGEVVRVAEGYGRNFLLPRKKAIVATDANLKRLAQEKQAIDAKRAKTRQEAEGFAQKISELKLSLEKQAGEEDKIFGSVPTREIADLLNAQGIVGLKVDKRLIRLKEPIRKLGEHIVEIHLHGDVVVSLKLEVVKK